MKKKLFAICLLLMALLLTGCGDSDAIVDDENTEQTVEEVQEEVIHPDAIVWCLGRKEGEQYLDLFPTEEESMELLTLLMQGMREAGYESFSHNVFYYHMEFDNGSEGLRIMKISDDGRAFMNGKCYELSAADAVLEMLDVWSKETRIMESGWEIEEWVGVRGETLRVDLVGVPEGEVVTWRSDNEKVCTVKGDAYGAEIKIVGSGVSIVTVEWTEQSDSIVVYGGQKEDYASKILSEDLKAAEKLAREDYEAWAAEEWCISMKVLEAKVNEEESRQLRRNYEGSRDGWIKEYLAENFVAVKVTYDCKLDHNKIWYEDGKITSHTYLTRANADSPWEITDYGYD